MSSTLKDFVTSLKKKSPFFEPNRMEAKNEESGRPESLVIFVVAKVGPNSPGQHYPVAVVRRDCGSDPMESIQGGIVLGFLQRIIAVFSHRTPLRPLINPTKPRRATSTSRCQLATPRHDVTVGGMQRVEVALFRASHTCRLGTLGIPQPASSALAPRGKPNLK